MIEFFKQFILHPIATGAVAPTGEALAELITNSSNLSSAKAVVEYGPGTGVFTEKILQKIGKETVFFALEINKGFVEKTRERCPTALVYEDSASSVSHYLNKNGTDECDCVISGLPFAGFSKELQEEIIKATVKALRSGGEFRTFAYIQGTFAPSGKRFKKLLQENFSTVKTSGIVWKNLFPAFVYICTK